MRGILATQISEGTDMKTFHGACGKHWWQAGERTSHCSGCHHTFISLAIFDAHQRGGECTPPEEVDYQGGPLETFLDKTGALIWYSPSAREAARKRFRGSDSGQMPSRN